MSRSDADPNRGNRRVPLLWWSAADELGLNDDEPAAPDRPEPCCDGSHACPAVRHIHGCLAGPPKGSGWRAPNTVGGSWTRLNTDTGLYETWPPAITHPMPPDRPKPGDRESVANRHQRHYRSCHCLGDSVKCCEPSCPCKISPEPGDTDRQTATREEFCNCAGRTPPHGPLCPVPRMKAREADAREQGYQAGKAEGRQESEALRTAVEALAADLTAHDEVWPYAPEVAARLRTVLDQHGGQQ